VEELWRRWKRERDVAARDRLVLHYSPLVKYVAGRVRSGLPSSVDQADLVSDGVIGLMDAVDKFEPERGLQFQTYAVPRIRGAIIDGLRATDWVPRSVRERARAVERATADLESRMGRPPTDEEVAGELSLSVGELRAFYGEHAHHGLGHLDTTDEADTDRVPARDGLPAEDDGVPDGFVAAVRALPERDQVVVALYYWERLTLAEIGRVLGVSESRISQLLSRATLTMRRRLTGSAT
jgi:RNA polymerase sigma factor for flagellar operon FliA